MVREDRQTQCWTKLCVQKIGDCARREKEQRCWSTVVHRHWSSTSGIGQAGTPVRSRSSSSSSQQQQSVVRRRGRLRTHWTVAAAWSGELRTRGAQAAKGCPALCERGLEQANDRIKGCWLARPHSSRGHSCMRHTYEETKADAATVVLLTASPRLYWTPGIQTHPSHRAPRKALWSLPRPYRTCRLIYSPATATVAFRTRRRRTTTTGGR